MPSTVQEPPARRSLRPGSTRRIRRLPDGEVERNGTSYPYTEGQDPAAGRAPTGP